MDFMSDDLFDGRRIRLLTIVDNYTRERLAIKVAASIKGERSCGCATPTDAATPLAEDHPGG